MNLAAYLALMAQKNASDLFFSAGAPVSIKIDGITRHVGDSAMPAADIRAMADSIMNDRQKQEFENNLEMNLAFSLAEQGRFRVNLYRQRGEVSMAVRHITSQK